MPAQQEQHTHPWPQPFSSTNPVLRTNYHIIPTMAMIGITTPSRYGPSTTVAD
ncbi:hypothetical protein L873DRAFT_1801186 [Choiromyces venosus 120613-1]|uniref:Uncharacterized protein n=1 Tax=Choiromyces venosus 120613-1 TaxID=1336337 RepID=A0A3N4JY01_9PEZI|nr:hypothetical protein L873DRAFT_1801186 [Choiromyces venosus 120613-1]